MDIVSSVSSSILRPKESNVLVLVQSPVIHQLKNSVEQPRLDPSEQVNRESDPATRKEKGQVGLVQTWRKGLVTMARRNARERNRVRQVNQGFLTLCHHIPEPYRMKKMSKVDTLRSAVDYIRNLEKLLHSPEEMLVGSEVFLQNETSMESTKEN